MVEFNSVIFVVEVYAASLEDKVSVELDLLATVAFRETEVLTVIWGEIGEDLLKRDIDLFKLLIRENKLFKLL